MNFSHFQNQCKLLNCNLLFTVKNENFSGCFEDCQKFILKFKLPSLKIHTVRSDLQQTFACQQMKYSSIEHFSTKLNFEMQKTKTLIKSVKAKKIIHQRGKPKVQISIESPYGDGSSRIVGFGVMIFIAFSPNSASFFYPYITCVRAFVCGFPMYCKLKLIRVLQ